MDLNRRSSSSFSWTSNPNTFNNPYATQTSKQQSLTKGKIYYKSDDIFQPQRERNKTGKTGSITMKMSSVKASFFDFSSPETLELRLVLGPNAGMKGLQVLTFIDGERTLRAQGATVYIYIYCVCIDFICCICIYIYSNELFFVLSELFANV